MCIMLIVFYFCEEKKPLKYVQSLIIINSFFWSDTLHRSGPQKLNFYLY